MVKRTTGKTSSEKRNEQRSRIAKVVLRVIAREGFERATVRRIAAEAGYSTTIVTHYFADKRELLLLAYQAHGEFARKMFEAAEVHKESDLVDYLMSMSSYDDMRAPLWRAYIAIWDTSLRDPDFKAQWRSWTEKTLTYVESFIKKLNPKCTDSRAIARRLLATLHGLSIQKLFDPDNWTEDEMRQTLLSEVRDCLHRLPAE